MLLSGIRLYIRATLIISTVIVLVPLPLVIIDHDHVLCQALRGCV